jgi:multidrug efflux pump
MCLLCSLAGVLATGRDVNIFVQIGLVVLVGLACKNAILIVEYAKEKHMEGWSRADATVEACRLRLRPILMTSLAFIIGVIPLALASGAGSEMRRSLGIAVFYGMVGVTLFGIFLTPVFFYVILGLTEAWRVVTTAARWVGSTLVGGLSGLGVGYMLARADIVPMERGLWACGAAGVLGTLAVLSFPFSVFRFQRRPRKPGGPPTDDSFATSFSTVPEEHESPVTSDQ